MDERLTAVLDDLGMAGSVEVVHERIETADHAARVGFRGSPTVLLDGRDIGGDGTRPTGLACRVYLTDDGPQGAPSADQLRAALR